jgi:hypothetical protein
MTVLHAQDNKIQVAQTARQRRASQPTRELLALPVRSIYSTT